MLRHRHVGDGRVQHGVPRMTMIGTFLLTIVQRNAKKNKVNGCDRLSDYLASIVVICVMKQCLEVLSPVKYTVDRNNVACGVN